MTASSRAVQGQRAPGPSPLGAPRRGFVWPRARHRGLQPLVERRATAPGSGSGVARSPPAATLSPPCPPAQPGLRAAGTRQREGLHSAREDISGAGVAPGSALWGPRPQQGPRRPPRSGLVPSASARRCPRRGWSAVSLKESRTRRPSVRVPRDCWGPALGPSTGTCSRTWLGTGRRGPAGERGHCPRARRGPGLVCCVSGCEATAGAAAPGKRGAGHWPQGSAAGVTGPLPLLEPPAKEPAPQPVRRGDLGAAGRPLLVSASASGSGARGGRASAVQAASRRQPGSVGRERA